MKRKKSRRRGKVEEEEGKSRERGKVEEEGEK